MDKTLLETVIEALNNLGGDAYYNDIYDEVERICDRKYANIGSMKSSIRDTIQRHSKNSERFTGKENYDIFYSVDGIGKGHWG